MATFAVAGVFNTDPTARRTFRVPLAQLGIGGSIKAADLWTGRSLGIVRGDYTVTVAPGGGEPDLGPACISPSATPSLVMR